MTLPDGRTDWDALIAEVGPFIDDLVAASGATTAAVEKALRRRGYSTGTPGQPRKDTVRIQMWILRDLVERAGGPEQFRADVRAWATRKYR